MKRTLLLLLALAFPAPGGGQAILNVEGLQRDDVEGLHGEITVRFRAASGNTDLFQLGGDAGAGFLGERHWIRGYLGMERLEQEGKDVLDNRYLHLRYNYRFSEVFRSFHFFQLQANQNLFLIQRRLIGSGLRVRALGRENGRLEVGTGLMLERELLDEERLDPTEDADVSTVRVANILVGSGPIGEGRRWVMVVYHQPNVEAFGDYRLSGEGGLAVELMPGLQLDLAVTWRHDSRAPVHLDHDDVEVKTGFTFRIR